MGGVIEGRRLIVAETPNHANLLHRLEFKTVKEILPLINKKSNNVMARQLFLSIAGKVNAPATPQKAYQFPGSGPGARTALCIPPSITK